MRSDDDNAVGNPESGAVLTAPSLAIEHEGIVFSIAALRILLAQSASAEVRRRFESEGSVFETIATNAEFQHAFLGSYVRANAGYFAALCAQMPAPCRRILDIGCGLGLLDLLLYRAARGAKPELFLFDKSVVPEALMTAPIAPTGFNDSYVFTASLQEAATFLERNGVARHDIRTCEVGTWTIPAGAPFDLVFSRKSWGFHYPLSQYLDEVAASVSAQGVVITDVRAGTGGEDLLRRYFADVRVLLTGSKSALVAARQPIPPAGRGLAADAPAGRHDDAQRAQ